MKTAKTVKVCILGNSEVMLAMKRATRLVNTITEIVKTIAEANLVVAENIREIEADFNKDKYYIVVTVESVKKDLPVNVFVFQAPFQLADYYKLIAQVSEKLAGAEK